MIEYLKIQSYLNLIDNSCNYFIYQTWSISNKESYERLIIKNAILMHSIFKNRLDKKVKKIRGNFYGKHKRKHRSSRNKK